MFIDTSKWKADHPGWKWNKNDATYVQTPGDSSSRLASPIMELGENRTITLSAELLGGYGIAYVRGYTKDGGNSTVSRGSEGGLLTVSKTFDETFDRYQLLLSAWPGTTHIPGKVIDPVGQVITFRNVSLGPVPTYGEVEVIEAAPPPPPPPPPVTPVTPVSRLPWYIQRILARFRR